MTNMDDRVYEGLVMRYSGLLGRACGDAVDRGRAGRRAGGAAASPAGHVPTGKPTTMIDFPSAASTPPVNIMSPEPGAPGSAAPPPRTGAPAATRRPQRRRPRRGSAAGCEETGAAESGARADADHTAEFSTAGTGHGRRQRLMPPPLPAN